MSSTATTLIPAAVLVLIACSSPDTESSGASGGGDGGSATATTDVGTGGESASTVGVGGAGAAGVGEPPPTWDNFAQNFFASYCTVCHSPLGQASADFNVLDIVRLRLNAIRCGTAPVQLDNCQGEHAPGWFPIGNGPKPTEAERWRTVDWCEANGPE